jgi:hypothetical protein
MSPLTISHCSDVPSIEKTVKKHHWWKIKYILNTDSLKIIKKCVWLKKKGVCGEDPQCRHWPFWIWGFYSKAVFVAWWLTIAG